MGLRIAPTQLRPMQGQAGTAAMETTDNKALCKDKCWGWWHIPRARWDAVL